MTLQNRKQNLIELSQKFNDLILSQNSPLVHKAHLENPWFLPENIITSWQAIFENWFKPDSLDRFTENYSIKDTFKTPKIVGLVLAGNIPFVGLHDVLMVYLSGHKAKVKLSSTDSVLMKSFISELNHYHADIEIAEQLKNCDAYIATGSNNSARYFEYYFGKYPSIIRKNRTSVAILTGKETDEEIELLYNDILLYFGLGCRNVSQIFVPKDFNFERFLKLGNQYQWLKDFNKFRNNYDYQLSLLIMNNQYYMTNEILILKEKEDPFAAISCLHYQFYDNKEEAINQILNKSEQIQCLVGEGYIAFGQTQKPKLNDFADGIDTMQFLLQLK